MYPYSKKPLTKTITIKQYVDKQKLNLLTCSDDGVWKMYILVSQYKNYRARGIDITELFQFPWWTALFEQYYLTYRPLLIGRSHANHNYIFVTRAGAPFTGNYFSEFISNLLHRHTGKRVATNLLRSSF
jgi:hypothetical protein